MEREEMTRFQTVDLSGYHIRADQIEFLRAEVPKEQSPFALIRYAIKGIEQPEGLRLDMHKRSFLDRPDFISDDFADKAPQIADALREVLPGH
jgi:hypothetical protein